MLTSAQVLTVAPLAHSRSCCRWTTSSCSWPRPVAASGVCSRGTWGRTASPPLPTGAARPPGASRAAGAGDDPWGAAAAEAAAAGREAYLRETYPETVGDCSRVWSNSLHSANAPWSAVAGSLSWSRPGDTAPTGPDLGTIPRLHSLTLPWWLTRGGYAPPARPRWRGAPPTPIPLHPVPSSASASLSPRYHLDRRRIVPLDARVIWRAEVAL